MKTLRYQAPPAAPSDVLTVDSRFVLFANGMEQEFSFFGGLYAVISLVRTRTPLRVFSAIGGELMNHDGTSILASNPRFQQAVLEFEQFLLAEQRVGHQTAFAEMNRLTDEAAATGSGEATSPAP